MSLKKLAIVLVLTVIVAGTLAGCRPAAAEEQTLRYNLGTEPQTLDSAQATGSPEITALNALMEGLTRLDKDSNCVPAAAESWDISDDGLIYTFHLRDGMQWSNGDPLTAEDFKYAWIRAGSPETAGDYSYYMWYIAGMENFFNGTGTADQVGLECPDPLTLKVTLAEPCAYWINLTAFITYLPVNKNVVEATGANYGGEAANIATCGPFKLDSWEHRNILTLSPLESYWDRESVKLTKIEFYCIEEESTELAMFESGQLDILENPPLEEMARLKEEGLQIAPYLGTYYFIFNTQQAPFDDVRVRQAFTLAINRQLLIDTVVQGNQVPAMAVVAPGNMNPVSGSDFREEGGSYFADNDVAKAQQLLAEAGYPGGEGFPPVEILVNNREAHIKISQALMEMWRTNLGLADITILSQEWGVYLETRDAGQFSIARAGWLSDFVDPMCFLDLWMTGGGNNNTFWGDPTYDQGIRDARKEQDVAKRFEIMHDLEDQFMAVNAICPVYFYTDQYMYKPYVKDVLKPPCGPQVEFKWAYIEGRE